MIVSNIKLWEYIATAIVLIGAILIALNTDMSKYGFILFLIGGPILAWVCYSNKLWGLVTLQVAYFLINVLGVFKWIF